MPEDHLRGILHSNYHLNVADLFNPKVRGTCLYGRTGSCRSPANLCVLEEVTCRSHRRRLKYVKRCLLAAHYDEKSNKDCPQDSSGGEIIL